MGGRLAERVAIVTGGATGIGEAICHKMAQEGGRVVVCGLPTDPIDDVVRNVGIKRKWAIPFRGDISVDVEAKACVDLAIRHFGKLDILVNNAGVFPVNAETQEHPVDDFEELLRHNVRTCFLMTKHALPHLRATRGCIISAGSEAGMNGLPYATVYGGTKGWIHAFMQGVAAEQAKYGVRANCVCAGPIDTAWTHSSMGPMKKKVELISVAATPLGRRGTPEEVANVYAFLASEEASYVTGALWLVDGGITISKGPLGIEAKRRVKKQPKGKLRGLRHAHDGLANKQTHTH